MSAERRTWLEYFAKELIAWRKFRGLTQEQLAAKVNYSASLVAMVETCERTPKPEFIDRCDQVMQTGGALRRMYDELLRREIIPDYLDRWLFIEEKAAGLNTFQLEVIPGLLQTADYARIVFQIGLPTATEDEIDAKVAARINRQQILQRDEEPPMFVAILDEGAIRRVMGSQKIMYEQLAYILDVCERRRNVRLQIVPREVGAYSGIGGPFTLATVDGDEFAYLDTTLSGHIVEDPPDVAIVRHRWESLRAEALPRTASRNLITEVAEQWTPTS